YFPENTTFQSLRTICLVAGAQGKYEKRDKGFERAQELCEQFGKWPFDMATGTKTGVSVNVYQVIEEEMKQNPGCELYLEVIAGVLEVFAGMESVF
ncbi:Golgi phospho protein 3, partial [Hanseniaspora valbyensis NRRL Y-1626]